MRTKPQANWFFRSLRKQNLDFSSGLFSYKLVHISYVRYRQDINALIGSSRPEITLVFFAFEGSWHWLFKYGCKRKWGPSLSLTIRWKKNTHKWTIYQVVYNLHTVELQLNADDELMRSAIAVFLLQESMRLCGHEPSSMPEFCLTWSCYLIYLNVSSFICNSTLWVVTSFFVYEHNAFL